MLYDPKEKIESKALEIDHEEKKRSTGL